MGTAFPALPGWVFNLTERPASVNKVLGCSEHGAPIKFYDIDYDDVLEQVCTEAGLMDSGPDV
jgi:hypothetical protein